MGIIINRRLIAKNDTIIVACSGGVDSVVLLEQLNQLKDGFHLKLIVAHVNHAVRPASTEEYEFVRSLAALYGLEFEGTRLDKLPHAHFHEAARKRRYGFFLELAEKYQADKIALAHHADDQAETIAMRIARGSSFKGYGGIAESTFLKDVLIIRPMLKLSKSEIVNYQEEHFLSFRHDASNDEDEYTRNRFRHHVLPEIEKENKNYREKFGQFAEYMQEANHLIERLSDEFLQKKLHQDENHLTFSVGQFGRLDMIVRRDVLKKIYDLLTGDEDELSYKQTNQLLKIIESEKPHAKVSLSSGILASKSYDDFEFRHDLGTQEPAPVIKVDGFREVDFLKDTIIVASQKPNIINGICIELWYNNLDSILPLTIRTRVEGDKIKTSSGTKKIKDLFIDLKLPMTRRDSLPLIFGNDGTLLWIPGIKVAKSSKNGDKVLYIAYKRGTSC